MAKLSNRLLVLEADISRRDWNEALTFLHSQLPPDVQNLIVLHTGIDGRLTVHFGDMTLAQRIAAIDALVSCAETKGLPTAYLLEKKAALVRQK